MDNDDKKVAQLENEVRVLKNEVQAVLLDLRERCLDTENPFNEPVPSATTTQQIVIERQSPMAAAPASERSTSPTADKEVKGNGQESSVAMDKNEAPSQTAPEEVKRSSQPEWDSSYITPSRNHRSDQGIDLVVIGGLARWAVESVTRLGRQRAETILDIAAIMGYLSMDLKQIMVKLVNAEVNGQTDAAAAREYLDSLIKLTTLLGKNNETETALLSILSGENNHR